MCGRIMLERLKQTGVAVVQIYEQVHSGSNSPLREGQAIGQAVVSVVRACPDADARKIRAMGSKDGLELCRGRGRVVIHEPGIFEINQGRKVGTVICECVADLRYKTDRKQDGRERETHGGLNGLDGGVFALPPLYTAL